MRKAKWILALAAALAAATAFGGSALVTQGANELAIQGGVDFVGPAGTSFDMGLKYAYFFLDGISLGTRVAAGNNRYANYVSLGLTGEVNFELPEGYEAMIGTDLVPYVGGAMDVRRVKAGGSETAVVFGGETGLKFFLTDTSAVNVALVGEMATKKIFWDDNKAIYWDLGIQVGMRFYF